MTTAELGKLFPIIIKPWNKRWQAWYQKEREIITENLGRDRVVKIDHIGSTAIPGIHAKPCVDILLQVPQSTKLQSIIKKLKELNYEYIHKPENPPPHMMFVKGYTKRGFKGQTAHIHVRYPGDHDELIFRDYLIHHPEDAMAYGELKLQLAETHKNDREAYTEAKTEFIHKVLKKATAF